MNLASKKYFSISEVSEITGLQAHRLRYLEKSATGMDVFQIRGRRYYTAANIELIKQLLGKDDELIQFSLFNTKTTGSKIKKANYNSVSYLTIIAKIDSLISRLTELELNIITEH